MTATMPAEPPVPPSQPADDGLVRRLTPAQRRVATCAAAGLYPDEIAEKLDVAERTVRAHVQAIDLQLVAKVPGRTAYRRVQRWARTHLGTP